MSRILLRILTASFLLIAGAASANTGTRVFRFTEPIDALSLGMPTDAIDLEVRGFEAAWTPWQRLTIEKEFDPTLRESSLVVFPRAVTRVEIRGTTQGYTLHPIRVSHEPVRWTVAAMNAEKPRILSRQEWGADESLLFRGEETSRSDVPPEENGTTDSSGGSAVPQRIKDCEEAQAKYPNEFKTERTVTQDEAGRTYRWPLSYSQRVRLLVVHHTALQVAGDERPPVERVRALYEYHANNRGWGDVGYHYLIDERGQVYEGKAGGKFVVGGHAYCNNTGSVGVVLLGNFELERPTQAQMKSLQVLLADLAESYDIAPDRDVRFHGKIFPPIVGHQDLLSTDCPGFYVAKTLDQVRTHVKNGDLLASIDFPKKPAPSRVDRMAERRAQRLGEAAARPVVKEGLEPVGSTEMTAPPGAQVPFSIAFHAGAKSWKKGAGVGTIARSDATIGLWQEKDGAFTRVRTNIQLPSALQSGESVQMRLKAQVPREPGDYTVRIDRWTYTLHASGRRLRSQDQTPRPMSGTPRTPVTEATVRLPSRPSRPAQVNEPVLRDGRSGRIRIRLGYPHEAARLVIPTGTTINGTRVDSPDMTLSTQDGRCISDHGGPASIVRIDPGDGVIAIASWERPTNRFRGVIECRVIDGKLTLVNELPMETYLHGLAEEDDSQPYEKQRAFAVAARTYATFYLDPAHRKFPGMPYDGSDSPAEFQSYGGAAFEEQNAQWVRAVDSTAGLVLTKEGQVIKTPYFSSDDGRTRSPEERGWSEAVLPFPEVFASKPDRWCEGKPLAGHGVGMSGCGALGQAREGKTGEQILEYYYPGTTLESAPR